MVGWVGDCVRDNGEKECDFQDMMCVEVTTSVQRYNCLFEFVI